MMRDSTVTAATLLTFQFRQTRHGPDTLGVDYLPHASKIVQVDSVIIHPGTTWELLLDWGPHRWTVPIDADLAPRGRKPDL
ncbi:MAG: hypothetical protein ACREL5_09150 [Gemmatimonadales bacterium]